MEGKCPICDGSTEETSWVKYEVVWYCPDCDMTFPDRSTIRGRYKEKKEERIEKMKMVPDLESEDGSNPFARFI